MQTFNYLAFINLLNLYSYYVCITYNIQLILFGKGSHVFIVNLLSIYYRAFTEHLS